MLLGEAPGAEEVKQGRGFAPAPAGRMNAGRVLWPILEDIGFSREDVSVTNAVKCRPPDNNFKLVGAKGVQACSHLLQSEIKYANPDIIIAFGENALRSVVDLGRSKFSEVRGQRLTSKYGVPVVATYHPAYLLRSHEPSVLDAIYNDIGRAVEKPSAGFDLSYLLNQSFMLPPSSVIDIEMSKGTGEISCLGFSSLTKPELSIITTPPSKWSTLLIGHFVISDFYHLRKEKWIPEQWDGQLHDTILLAQLLGSRDNYSLKSFAQDYDFPIYWSQVRETWDKKEDPVAHDLHIYNAHDVELTKKIYNDLYPKLSPEKKRYYDNFLSPALRLCVEMQLNGVYISPEIRKAAPAARKRVAYQERMIRFALGEDKKINLNGNIFKRKLFERLNVTPKHFTRTTHQPSFDRKALQELAPQDKTGVLQRYLRLSVLEKQKQFVEQLLPHAGSIIHPMFNLGGVGDKDWTTPASPVTGRLSSSKPNIQQFPPWLRRFVISRFEGGQILKWDAKQIEIKVAYCYSRDPAFLKADLHQSTTDLMNRTLPRHFTRADGKKANFAVIYGAEVNKLRTEFGLDEGDATLLRNALREEFMLHFNWIHDTRKEAQRTGMVTSITGRTWFLPKAMVGDNHALNQITNYPIQNPASDFNLLAAMRIGPRGSWGCLQSLLHDEGDCDVTSERCGRLLASDIKAFWRNDLAENVRRIFGYDLPIDFSCEVKMGPNWFEMEEIG